MRKGRDGKRKKKRKEKKKKKRKEWRFQWPLRHCQQSTARTRTAGTPHARAKKDLRAMIRILYDPFSGVEKHQIAQENLYGYFVKQDKSSLQ